MPSCSLVLVAFSLQILLSTASSYDQFLQSHKRENGLAPLYGTGCNTSIPDEYGTMFWPGYTLEQHYLFIGKNLSDTAGFADIGVGYLATLDDDILHSGV